MLRKPLTYPIARVRNLDGSGRKSLALDPVMGGLWEHDEGGLYELLLLPGSPLKKVRPFTGLQI